MSVISYDREESYLSFDIYCTVIGTIVSEKTGKTEKRCKSPAAYCCLSLSSIRIVNATLNDYVKMKEVMGPFSAPSE